MVNFCTNCGTELGKDDNFCKSCGTKIIKDDIFCTNCGTKLGKDDNFCINCGAKTDKAVKNAKEKEEEKKRKLNIIDEIFESEEIKSEIRKNKADSLHVKNIRYALKSKIVIDEENLSEGEIKFFIKTELEKIRVTIEKERNSKKIEDNKRTYGGYCDSGCSHYFEEFLNSSGEIVGDLDCEGYVEYYCRLGHSLGGFCKDYK